MGTETTACHRCGTVFKYQKRIGRKPPKYCDDCEEERKQSYPRNTDIDRR